MMDFSGLPDQEQPETGGDLLSGLPDTNAGTLRKQYRSTALAPDTAAKVVDLSAKSGLPRVTVERNQQFAERKASEPDWDALEITAPVTARTLAANAHTFEIAHDDTENLGAIERTFKGTLQDIAVTAVKGAVGLPQAFVGLADIPTLGRVGKTLDAAGVRFNDTQNILGTFYSPAQQAANTRVSSADGFFETVGAALQNPSVIATNVGESLPQILGGAGAARGLLKVAPKLSPVIASAIGEGLTGAGSAAEQTRAGGADGTLSPKQSVASVVSGIGTAVFAVLGGKTAQRLGIDDVDVALTKGGIDLPTAGEIKKGFVRRLAEGGISEGVFEELPQSTQEQVWQNFAADQPLLNGVGNASALGLLAGAVTGGGFAALIGPHQALQKKQDQADRAMKSADGLAQLAKLAAESKLRGRGERGIQAFQTFVEAANEEGGVQDVYLDTNTLLQAGVDLEALAKLSPVVAEQLKQPNIGGDLVIPGGEYAARIAGTDVDTLLAPHLRVSEDALSSVEAQAFYQNQGEEFAKAAQQVMEEKANDTAWTDSAKVVETQLFDQLQQTGRFTADANKAYATLMRDFYVTTAGRLNLTPEEMFAKYPLQITSESKAGGKTMEYGQPDTEAFKNWFGDSKVVDAEGKPLVVYHGTGVNVGNRGEFISGDFDTFSPELSGKSSKTGAPAGTFFFTDNPEVASSYTVQWRGDFSEKYKEKANVMPVHLSLKKPLKVSAKGENWREILYKGEYRDVNEIAQIAKESGKYDGVIITRVKDHGVGKTSGGPSTTYIAFEPTQIKSAIGNQGTYDPNDPNILRQNALDPGQFFQGPQHRGEITLADDITQQPTFLSLLKNADLSTFLHEMGHFQLEVLAHIASQPNAPVEITEDLNKILGWFGITGNEAVTGGEKSGELGQPDTEAFKNWFGDSKVVDAEGKPLVVYHGTGADFSSFSPAEKGKNTGAKSAGEGYWFSADATHAAGFNASRVGNRVVPVYLSLKNPLIVDHGKFDAQEAHPLLSTQAEKLRLASIKKAKKKGHDGVVFKNTFDTFASGEAGVRRVDLYLAFEPTQIKSAIGNQGTYDPNDPNILRQGDDATQPDATNLPPGRTPLEVWQAMSLEEKRPFHEQFARGFEAYLFEGKAPSVELNRVFARLRSWLINVYKSVVNLRVEINDDIRGVFDRLLATESAIKQAEEMRAYGALYTSAEQMGMDAEGWAEYQRTAAEATDEAMTTLQKRSLRDMQWLTNARNRTLKKLQQDAKAKRNAVQEEVTAEVQEMPLYAALRFIRQGEGNNVTKLSLPDLKEMYGEEPAAPWRYLPVGLAANEGLAPDRIAELFGFTSGDHLVRSILEQSSEKDMIEGLTDQRMLERYGDINSPEALSRAADEAIHNDMRARAIATGLKALDKSNTPARVIAQAAKAFAEATIARKKVREIRPSQHAAAEVRAGKNALKALAGGDNRLAAIETRNQLIQNLCTREAYNALSEIEKAVRYLRKFDKEGPRKSIDVGYLDQIDQLLERFDFRASVTNKAAKKRESLLAWLEEQRLQGFEPDVPQELQTEALRKPYRELTMEELRGLIDTVKQIGHLGRLKRKLLTSKDAREFQEIRDEIAASIEEHAKKTVDLRTRSNTAEALKSGGKHFLAMHRKMASLARELDGFKDGGPMWEYFIRSMNSAGDTETTKRGDATARLFELVKPLLSGGKMGGKGRYFETLQGSFNREERIAIALNLGNAGNTQRLLDGEGWSMPQLRPLLDTITPEEAAFVQNIWDFFESYRPEIAAKERRVYGKEPNWVEPTPITLGGQQLRGGYYPIRYDANRTGKAEQFAAAEEAKAQMKGAFTSSTTRRSFTKTRAEEVVGRPLVYSFSGLYLGANEVIHDLAWHEWLIDANRLVRSLDGVIRLHYGPEGVAVFKKGIEDIAAGDAGAANAFEKGLNHIRTGATIAGLGWNLTTSLFQPLGLLPSMVRVGPGWMAKGIGQFLAHPKRVSREITAKSAMMTDRAKTMQREINEIQNQIQASKLDPVRATFFVLIQKAQWIADAPTWLGAYERATAEGNDEERAVALADQAVLDSQGGGQTKDLAQIQRGGPLLKLWTNFYSYFNTVYNLGAEKTNEKIGSPKLYPSLALDYLLLYIAPAALITILRDALSGGDDDDLVKKLLADQISNVTGLLIGLRETTAALQKVAGVEQYKGAYGGPAGLRLFQELDKLGQQVGQGEADEALFKAINNVGGIVFHYPSGQVARTVGGAAAMFEGKTENPAALVLGPPRK